MYRLQSNNFKNVVWLIKIAAICLLLGRAWQHFFWTTPYGIILPIEQGLQMKYFNTIIGVYLLGGGVVGLVYRGKQKWQTAYLYGVVAIILFLSVCYWVTKNYRFVQFFEYSIHIGTVWMLIYLYKSPVVDWQKTQFILKVLIACTFTSHGLYALGFPYATPAGFIEMTTKILGLDHEVAIIFLKLAGFLDLLLSVGLFFKNTEKPALYYAFCWGILTALARTAAYFDALSPVASLHRWFYETLHRMPHALLPLALMAVCGFLFFKKEKRVKMVD